VEQGLTDGGGIRPDRKNFEEKKWTFFRRERGGGRLLKKGCYAVVGKKIIKAIKEGIRRKGGRAGIFPDQREKTHLWEKCVFKRARRDWVFSPRRVRRREFNSNKWLTQWGKICPFWSSLRSVKSGGGRGGGAEIRVRGK